MSVRSKDEMQVMEKSKIVQVVQVQAVVPRHKQYEITKFVEHTFTVDKKVELIMFLCIRCIFNILQVEICNLVLNLV